MANAPWWIPTIIDDRVTSYAGPFADEEARDAYASAYDGPDPLGTAIQAVSDPNASIPRQTMRYAARDGDKVVWSDGNTTDA